MGISGVNQNLAKFSRRFGNRKSGVPLLLARLECPPIAGCSSLKGVGLTGYGSASSPRKPFSKHMIPVQTVLMTETAKLIEAGYDGIILDNCGNRPSGSTMSAMDLVSMTGIVGGLVHGVKRMKRKYPTAAENERAFFGMQFGQASAYEQGLAIAHYYGVDFLRISNYFEGADVAADFCSRRVQIEQSLFRNVILENPRVYCFADAPKDVGIDGAGFGADSLVTTDITNASTSLPQIMELPLSEVMCNADALQKSTFNGIIINETSDPDQPIKTRTKATAPILTEFAEFMHAGHEVEYQPDLLHSDDPDSLTAEELDEITMKKSTSNEEI